LDDGVIPCKILQDVRRARTVVSVERGPTTEEEAMSDKQRKTIQRTPEQRAEHRAIREAFRDWHPGPEELIASGAAARLGLNVIHFPGQELLRHLKTVRETAGLTLADVSARCGIDQPALSRLENGLNRNPTLDTLWRYAAAVGKRLVLATEDVPDARAVASSRRRPPPKKAASRNKRTA
jgi:DNA-binding XRE family transcriptional regulator